MDVYQIESVFKEYLTGDIFSQALLFNGDWGAGKTYFWEQTLQEIAKNSNLKPIRISLSGIDSIQALEERIARKILTPTFEEINEQKNSKIKGFFFSLVDVASDFAKNKVGINITDFITKNAIELHDYSKDVVCFDDFERCPLPIKEIMGYIGDWIEARNSKVIILVNENEIGYGQENSNLMKDIYKKTKEKIVSFSFDFEQDIAEIFSSILLDSDEKICQEKEYLINLCQKFKINNIRTLIQFFKLSRNVVNNLDEKYCAQLKSILTFMLFIINEARSGFISLKNIEEVFELKNIDNIQFYMSLRKSKNDDNENKKSYGERFYEKYLKDRDCDFYFYQSLLKYILSGFLDRESFKAEISHREKEKISPEYATLNAFYRRHFSEFEELEFKSKIKELFKFADKGVYKLKDYYSIAQLLFGLNERKMINYSSQKILYMCRKGISLAKKKDKDALDGKDSFFLRSDRETPEIKQVYEMISKAKKDLMVDSLKTIASEFLNMLLNSSYSEKQFKEFVNENLYADFIIYINKIAFIRALRTTTNAKINLAYCFIEERYKISPNLKSLNDELIWIKDVSEKIDVLLKQIGKKNVVRIYNLKFLIKTMKEISERCKNDPTLKANS